MSIICPQLNNSIRYDDLERGAAYVEPSRATDWPTQRSILIGREKALAQLPAPVADPTARAGYLRELADCDEQLHWQESLSICQAARKGVR